MTDPATKTIKVRDLENFTRALTALAEQGIPFEYSLPLGIYIKNFKNTLEVTSEKRRAIAEKWADKGEDGKVKVIEGGRITITDPEAQREFSKAIDEMEAVELALPGLPTIPVEKVKMWGISVSGNTVAALYGLVLVPAETAAPKG